MIQEKKRLTILKNFYDFKDRQIEFFDLALSIFQYQSSYNVVFKEYLGALQHRPRSRHLIRDLSFYLDNAVNIFNSHFGAVHNYCFLALLPGYLERKGSSLVEMVKHFIQLSKYEESGFFLDEIDKLIEVLENMKAQKAQVVLFGVSFALLELFSTYQADLSGITIIETGGMKARGKELTKKEIFKTIKENTNGANLCSEYGMTELLSQAYAIDSLHFDLPSTMRVVITEINDPFAECTIGKAGQINVVDLANIDTCAFIQTQDLGRLNKEGQLEILGRVDDAEMRGCNLLLDEIY